MTFALPPVANTATESLALRAGYFAVQFFVPLCISRLHLGRAIAAAILINGNHPHRPISILVHSIVCWQAC